MKDPNTGRSLGMKQVPVSSKKRKNKLNKFKKSRVVDPSTGQVVETLIPIKQNQLTG